MSRWHNQYMSGYGQFITVAVTDWRPILVGGNIAILYEEWNSAREILGAHILAYVVMPTHIHLLVWAEEGRTVEQFVRRVLSLTTKRIPHSEDRLWRERPMIVPVSFDGTVRTKVDYIHRNPVRKELVETPDQWEHSSFRQIELGRKDVPFLCDDCYGVWS